MKTLLEQAFELIRKGEYTTKIDYSLKIVVSGLEFSVGCIMGTVYLIGYHNLLPDDIFEIVAKVYNEYEQLQKEAKRQELLKQLEELN
jgi:hypothetical protein